MNMGVDFHRADPHGNKTRSEGGVWAPSRPYASVGPTGSESQETTDGPPPGRREVTHPIKLL